MIKTQCEDNEDNNTFIVHDRTIACSGAPSPHDHPVVYYYIMQPNDDGSSIDGRDDNTVICMYCNKKYIYQDAVSSIINGRSFQGNKND